MPERETKQTIKAEIRCKYTFPAGSSRPPEALPRVLTHSSRKLTSTFAETGTGSVVDEHAVGEAEAPCIPRAVLRTVASLPSASLLMDGTPGSLSQALGGLPA